MALSGRARERFFEQASVCESMGSPFTARIIRRLAAALGPDSRFGARIQDWPGDPRDDATPLRAASALHALRRQGDAALAAVYPPERVDDAAIDAALADALPRADAFLHSWLDSPPQTNEIARSGALLGGLLRVAAETGLPIALWEIGASAGLNLRLDRFRFELGEGRVWGPADATVTIPCDWRIEDPAAAPPLDAPLRIVERAGCDRAPLDPADAGARERLMAYLWADQTERTARTAAALDLAAADGAKVAAADAADWLAERLSAAPVPGRARVVQHTIFWQYLPAETQARIEAMLAEAGRAATPETPLARVSMERDAVHGSAGVTLQLWRGGPADGARRALGRAHYHGRWARWTGA